MKLKNPFKQSPFKVFQKREQKKIWKQAVAYSLIGLFFALGLYLYFLLAPFKDFFWRMPSMLGFLGERNYLILVQNNAEIRPTGGFITAYGEFSAFMGFVDLKFRDSYDIEAPSPQIEPPYPLNNLLKDDVFYKGFVFRDANWSPDFKESAKTVTSLYKEGQDRVSELDGLIALDFTVFEELLKLTGPVERDGITFTSDNVFHLMQFFSKNIDLHSVEDLASRKNVMKELIPLVMKKIVFSPSKYDDVIRLMAKLFDERHIQLSFQKESWQNIAERNTWAGRLQSQKDNFVHVNRANIGGRKADRYIRPHYRYTVSFDESGQGHVQLDMEYNYTAAQGLYTDFYQAYVRTYIPATATNIKHWGDSRSPFQDEQELGFQTVGTLIHMWPGETQELHISYDLDPTITPENYALHIVPQAGSLAENWEVILRHENTDSFWVSDDFETQEHVAWFHDDLTKETIITAQQEKDTTAPVIIWQKFLNNNTIELLFSEALNEVSLKADNISVYDKNVNNTEVQDTPVVVSVSQDDDYRVYIKLKNTSWQYEEHFKLLLENISDLAGNSLQPNPREITVVQR